MDISAVDKNFKVETNIDRDDIKFYNADEAPFKVYGVFRENGKYRRMPESVAKTVSEGVYFLHANTAGGRVKFVTDSIYVAIYAEMENVGHMSHFAVTGSVGFDMYVKNSHITTFIPPFEAETGYGSIREFANREMREITINFPAYSDVKNLYIGLEDKASVKEATPYRNKKPVVYYGSSITQGGCVSRPGRTYQEIISRRFNYDYINLGFSGSARAEDEMIDYIKSLDMSLFVYDYDHNAPTTEHLRNTHEKMFKAIREAHPALPIIMMSRPKYTLTPEEEERMQIICCTYENAVNSGDENVYLITGKELCSLCGDEGTVDTCHPTDLGFYSMAAALGGVMEDIVLV